MTELKLNLVDCKETLQEGIDRLSKILRERKDLSPIHQIKYAKAFAQLTAAHIVLKSVKCVQPNMSLEIPDPPPDPSERRSSRKNTTRKKSSKRRSRA
jgi:hypothetical protein